MSTGATGDSAHGQGHGAGWARDEAAALLLRALVDDAAVYPPGNAPLGEAVAHHLTARSAWYAPVVGPLLVPASSVAALPGLLPPEVGPEAPLAVGIIADGGLEGLLAAHSDAASEPRLHVLHGEIAVRGDDVRGQVRSILDAAEFPDLFVEIPLRDRAAALAALDEVAAHESGESVKLRTGGTAREAFPDEETVAWGLRCAIDRDLGVKLTAGLHHAVRHTDPATGFEHHGFLNALVAVRAALLGAEVEDMARLLAERDPARLLPHVHRMSEPDATVVRSFLRSFGCCGVTDPVADLVDLGLLRAST
ncbi:MAG TPA: hypothetical protein VFR99_05415 [Marmoricola sp.]|nr:hypothetical protein [Marmoricola sp.]